MNVPLTTSPSAARERAAELTAAVVAGDRRAAARAITILEDATEVAPHLLSALYPHTGRAFRMGLTGPPGAGKSTLVDALAVEMRKRDMTVGILSVDPSSPFTRGALLGDRVRMGAATADSSVFMRSMASRGALGGLAHATLAAADVLDALGQDIIIFETVGVGQSELEVSRGADVTAVVLTPESGSGVQMIKAGLMEVADVLVVNKADREGAERMEMELLDFLDMVDSGQLMRGRIGAQAPAGIDPWEVPVVLTQALDGRGVCELLDALLRYRGWLEQAGIWASRRLRQARARLREMVLARVEEAIWQPPSHVELIDALARARRIADNEESAFDAVVTFLERIHFNADMKE
jgi:LAO/AO transport system kinase